MRKKRSKRASQKKRPTVLAKVDLKAECNFDDFRNDAPKLEACFYYEYARESQHVTAVAAGATPSEAVSIFKRNIADVLRRSLFPVPWKALPEAQKAELGDCLPDTINTMDHGRAANIVEGELGKLADPFFWNADVVSPLGAAVVRTGAFAMNLGAGPPAIGREFERWAAREIRRLKEVDGILPPGIPSESDLLESAYFRFRTPGPNSWLSGLRRLGAMRWQYYCVRRGRTFLTAQEDPELFRARSTYYLRAPDFNSACREAVRIFKEMYPTEAPMRFSGGWPRATKKSRQ